VTDHLPDKYLECRMLGHAWTIVDPGDLASQFAFASLAVECDRCPMIRVDGFDVNGNLSTRKYVRPDDYRLPRDSTPSRADLRVRWARRARRPRR
jgi:hypothetical protein